MLEGQDEGAAVGSHLIPRVDGHNDEQRADVEPRMRIGTELIARGMDFSGSFASPAVMPMISMPP